MPAWSADRELEVACRIGSLSNFERAIEEGADVNCDGGSPLFLAIMGNHRQIVEELVARQAEVSMFLRKSEIKKLKSSPEIVEALMAGAPPPVEDDESPPEADEDEIS